MDTWTLLKRHYNTFLSLPKDSKVLDYIATYDILLLCARGKSNQTIATELDEDLQYVTETIYEMFGVAGYTTDLDFDSRNLYQRFRYNRYVYLYYARESDKINSEEVLKKSYLINTLFSKIEKEIDEYDATA